MLGSIVPPLRRIDKPSVAGIVGSVSRMIPCKSFKCNLCAMTNIIGGLPSVRFSNLVFAVAPNQSDNLCCLILDSASAMFLIGSSTMNKPAPKPSILPPAPTANICPR